MKQALLTALSPFKQPFSYNCLISICMIFQSIHGFRRTLAFRSCLRSGRCLSLVAFLERAAIHASATEKHRCITEVALEESSKRRLSQVGVMAKSKNHTAHNQTYKQHKNGIKKQKKFRYSSRKGVRSLLMSLQCPEKGCAMRVCLAPGHRAQWKCVCIHHIKRSI